MLLQSTVELNGVVKDELGKPLSGAVVSALGSTSAFAISNEDGHFTFRNLPPGPYLMSGLTSRTTALARSGRAGQRMDARSQRSN